MKVIAVITEPEEVKKPTASGEGWPATTRAGTRLRVMINLSPYPFRGIRMSALRSLDIQRAVFLVRSARRSTQEVQLFGNLLCAAEDQREGCLYRLDGFDIRGLACPLRIITLPIT